MNLLEEKPANDQPQYLGFNDLVGEGKKYKTQEDAAKAIQEKDSYINTIIAQKDEFRDQILQLREQQKAVPKLQEILDQYETRQKTSSNEQTPMNDDQQKTEIDPAKIEELISSRLQRHDLEKTYKYNYSQVESKLRERHGNSYASVLKQQMDELGLTQEEVNDLARKSPKAFFNTFNLNESRKETFQAPDRNTYRTDVFAPKGNTRNEAYYDKLKRENLSEYLNPKTQVQMHKDAQEQGVAYFT